MKNELSIEEVQKRFMDANIMKAIEDNPIACLFRADVGYLLSQLSYKHPDHFVEPDKMASSQNPLKNFIPSPEHQVKNRPGIKPSKTP